MPMPEVPDNLRDLSAADFAALQRAVAEAAAEFAGLGPDEIDDDTLARMNELAAAAEPVTAEAQRRETVNAAADANAALAALAPAEPEAPTAPEVPAEPETPAGEADPDPEGDGTVVAADGTPAPPRVADIAAAQAPKAPAGPASPRLSASMVAAAEVPGVPAGQALGDFNAAAKVVQARLDNYSMSGKTATIAKRPIEVTSAEGVDRGGRLRGATTYTMRNYARHQAVNFKRDYPEQLRLSSLDGAEKNLRTLEAVASEKRLTGGSLVAAMNAEVKQTGNLVAAQGWCAPSETIYDLCEQESMDGILPVPEVTADRGGFNIPVDGGIDFSTIFTGIGNSGDTHLTEDEVINDTTKVCTEIPCPEFEDVRLGVDYVCLTGSLLQRQGYPEVIQRFSRGAMVALAHKINQGVIAGIEAGSTDGGTMENCLDGAGGDDAAAALFAALEAAKLDILYRARMPFTTTVEVVLPLFVLGQIRAALSRRRGVNLLAVTDAEIMSMFAIRGIAPRFVYDWQDAFSDGGVGGMGGATPRTALPTEARFIMYPAGTWVKAVQPVVNLDTVYDSTLLSTNQYTALFAEDGWAVMKMCPISRVFTVALDPCGCLCGSDAVIESP